MILEGVADVLDPWPIKIVLDYIIGSKAMPEWLASLTRLVPGEDKQAVLNFAAIAVIAVAVVGAISSYTEDYLTTKAGQWVMHDLRPELYHHIQRLSFSDYDRQKTGDLISRITNDIDAIQDFVSSALLGIVVAHRLTTIKDADLIYVLDDGRIVESRTHAALLAHPGLYAHLYESQFHLRETEGQPEIIEV